MISEKRLIGRTLETFNQTTKTSTRGAPVAAAPTPQTFTPTPYVPPAPAAKTAPVTLDPAKYPDPVYRKQVEDELNKTPQFKPGETGTFIDPKTGRDTRINYDTNGNPTNIELGPDGQPTGNIINPNTGTFTKNVLPAGNKVISGTATATSRIDEINKRMAELDKPVNPVGAGGMAYTPEQQEQMRQQNAQEKIRLQNELQGLNGEITNNQNAIRKSISSETVTTPGAAPAGGKGTINSSRKAAVFDLVKQGITNPAQILDYLNFDDQGHPTGDFTEEEVAAILDSRKATTALAAPAGTPGGLTTTQAALQAVMAGSDPLTAGYLGAASQILSQRMAQLPGQYADDTELADAEFEQLQTILSETLNRADGLKTFQTALAKTRSEQDEELAKTNKDAAMRANETERQINQFRNNQAKRDLELGNKKRVEHLANEIAVAGGFGSMNNLAEVDRVQFEGDQAVANFVTEMTFADATFLNRAADIENGYTNTVLQIHRNYSDNLLSAVTKYNDRVDEVENLLRGGSAKRADEYRKARAKLRDEWTSLQDKSVTLLKEGTAEAGRRADALRKEQFDREKNVWSQTMQYMALKGTQDKEQLSTFEQALGLAPGTLGKTKTLAELRMKRYSGGGTVTPQSVEQYVSSLRTQIMRGDPKLAKNGQSVDTALLEATQSNYSGAKNAAFRIAVQNYVNDNNINSEPMSYADPSKAPGQYFVGYKFHPQLEFNQIQVGEDDLVSQFLNSEE